MAYGSRWPAVYHRYTATGGAGAGDSEGEGIIPAAINNSPFFSFKPVNLSEMDVAGYQCQFVLFRYRGYLNVVFKYWFALV